MKRIILLVLLFTGAFAQAQQNLSPQAKIFLQDLSHFIHLEDGSIDVEPSLNFQQSYDLIQMDGEWAIGVLVLTSAEFQESSFVSLGIRVETRMGNLLGIRVPLRSFYPLSKLKGIVYLECGNSFSMDLDRARTSTRVDSVYMGLGDLTMPYTGKGVIIGIIDWGFDYTHPVFYDTTMTNYRVLSAWDQNKNAGPGPAKYGFGTEYVGKADLLAAGDDTLYVFGPGSHGTHTSGIAGGGGALTKFRGMAPEADLVFVSLKRDDASFIAAINYIKDVASAAGKPWVINMSFGNHSGPHDGSTLRNRAMDSLVVSGGVLVASAGNNGGNRFHLQSDFANNDTLITEVVSASGLSGYWGESVNIWADPNKSFEVQLELCDANYTPVYQSNWFATVANLSSYDTLYQNAGDTLVVRLVSEAANVLNNKPNLLFESRNLGTLHLILRVKGTGNTHLWHVAQLNNRVTNWGQTLKAGYPGAVQGNDEYAVGGPPGVGKSTITVAAYLAEAKLPNGQDALGWLSSFSSYGPTADERQKPDVAAPGENVASSVNSFDPDPGIFVETLDFNGRTYGFVRYSGTSMSSPATAGVVALMLQANRFLTAEDVKEILKATARLDNNTGAIGPDGDLGWGWGKVNAYAAVRAAEIRSGNIHIKADAPFKYYPNPVNTGVLQIESETGLELIVRDVQGKELRCQKMDAGSAQLNLDGLAAGAYLIEWHSGSEAGFVKIVVQ